MSSNDNNKQTIVLLAAGMVKTINKEEFIQVSNKAGELARLLQASVSGEKAINVLCAQTGIMKPGISETYATDCAETRNKINSFIHVMLKRADSAEGILARHVFISREHAKDSSLHNLVSLLYTFHAYLELTLAVATETQHVKVGVNE